MNNKKKGITWKSFNTSKVAKQTLGALMVAGTIAPVAMSATKVQAASILGSNKVEQPTSSTTISGKYDFLENFNPATTQIKTFGGTFEEAYTYNGTARNLTAPTVYNPSDSQKGKLGVIYTNTGSYKGKPTDTKLTIMDWKKSARLSSSSDFAISYWNKGISLAQESYDWIIVKHEVLDHNTGAVIDTKGAIMNQKDIDTYQYLGFDQTNFAKIDKIMAVASNVLQTDTMNNTGVKYYSNTDTGVEDTEQSNWVTTLMNTSTYEYYWGRDWTNIYQEGHVNTLKGKGPDGGNKAARQWMSLDGSAPAKILPMNPTKFVTDTDETKVNANTINNRTDSFSYDITQGVPDETENNYFKTASFKDTLIPELVPSDVKVVDETGKDVTSQFDNKSKGNVVELAAKSSFVASKDFYAHTYDVSFNTKVKPGADISKYLKKSTGNYVFPNKASWIFDGKAYDSNQVTTKVKQIKPQIVKKVEDTKGNLKNTVHYNDYLKGKNVNFDLFARIGNDGATTKIGDDLLDVINVDNVKVYADDTATKSADDTDAKAKADATDATSQDAAGEDTTGADGKVGASDASSTDATATTGTDASADTAKDDSTAPKADATATSAATTKGDITKGKYTKDVTSQGKLSIDKKTSNVVWTPKDSSAFAGKSVKIKISTSLKDDAASKKALAKYLKNGKYTFDNIGTISEGGTKLKSNKVNVIADKPAEKKADREVASSKLPQTGHNSLLQEVINFFTGK